MSEIQITDLTEQHSDLVFVEGQLMEQSDATRRFDVRDIIDPLGFPLKHVVSEYGSLLFPENTTTNLHRYSEDNGIFVGHVADETHNFHGYVALGHVELFNEPEDKKSTIIMETLTHRLSASLASAVVSEVIELYDIQPEFVKHFSPLKSKPLSRSLAFWRKPASTQEPEKSLAPIGEKIEVIMPDGSVNGAYGLLETLSSYSQRIG